MSDKTGDTLVVGVDFAETGDNALREALRLARQRPGTEIHAVYVHQLVEDPRGRELDALSTHLAEEGQRLQQHVAKLCRDAGQDAETRVLVHVRLGKPAKAIHQLAVDVDADVIVVGTRGRRGLDKLVLGSVAEELARTARTSVLVAHPKDYQGLRKSDYPEPARPDDDFSRPAYEYELHLPERVTHIPGLV